MLSGRVGKSAVMMCAALAVTAGMRAQESAAAVDGGTTVALEAGASGVRIVRLSQARGGVQMDRNTGRGFEAAFANIPVVAGAALRTKDGVAEVEFEDNSTLRLAPGSEVRVLQLSRTATGATETTVEVVRGLVYVSLEKTKGNAFALVDGKARMDLSPGAHLRLDATQPEVELAVFEGGASVVVGGVTTQLAKRQTVELNPAAQTVSTVVGGNKEVDWDGWDKQSTDYHKLKAGLAGSGGYGLYGANDLNYYGSFADMPGCGTMWRPYLASAGWDPFANGIWAFYPGAGYSWVSPYPWGWLPFHSGAWAQCGAGGWGWRPGGGGAWMGLTNAAVMKIAKYPQPHPTPGPPVKGKPTLVAVNVRPLTVSGAANGSGAFTFRRDSAGLGVPRAEFGSLRGVSNHAEQHGMATSTAASFSSGGAVNAYALGGAATPGVPRSGAMSNTGGMSGGMRSAPVSMPSAGPSMSAPSASAGGAAAGHK